MWLNDILTTHKKSNLPDFSDISDLQKTKVGQKITMQHIKDTVLSDLSDMFDQRKNICQAKEAEIVKEVLFCPLDFLNERGVGVMDIAPAKGMLLTTDYFCNDTLRYIIELWTLGHFESLLKVLKETRPITRKVRCISLDRYTLPKKHIT